VVASGEVHFALNASHVTAFAIEMAMEPQSESRNRLGNPSGDLAVVWTSVDVWTKPSATCRFRRGSKALQCADGRLLP
jgi:hypothetical protein